MNSTDEHTVVEMLSRYGFDLGGQTAANLVRAWRRHFDPNWLLPAVIETLDRGRYKAASVEQVLTGWQRRGEANPRFSADFAAMVLGKVEASPELLDDSEINEALLDAEIVSCAESITNPPLVDLSNPVLDEDQSGGGDGAISPSFFASTLMASPYPPLPLRKPDDNWQEKEVEVSPALPENFMPSSQFSQFYYRLLAMAETAPGHQSTVSNGGALSCPLTSRSVHVAEG